MSKEEEQIYVPRFEYESPGYYFGSKRVYNAQLANKFAGLKDMGGKIFNKELYRNEVWVDFGKLDGNQIIAIDDAFVTYKPDVNSEDDIVCVWDKPAVHQADWWELNAGKKPDLIEFTSQFALWGTVPKAPNEEKSNAVAKTFETIQNIFQEEEKYTANRFFNLKFKRSDLINFKTGILFKTRPNVFDLLIMNHYYDFIIWHFINTNNENASVGAGLTSLETYLKGVKQNRNKYLENQYGKQL